MPAWNPVHRIDDDTTTENHEDTNVDNFDNIATGYDSINIFNGDEKCFYIKGQDKKSYIFDEQSEPKKDNEKLTAFIICSMKGENFSILYIGKSKNPRCFKNINLEKEGIFYASNKIAWMTLIIFNQYMEFF